MFSELISWYAVLWILTLNTSQNQLCKRDKQRQVKKLSDFAEPAVKKGNHSVLYNAVLTLSGKTTLQPQIWMLQMDLTSTLQDGKNNSVPFLIVFILSIFPSC